MHKTIIFIAAIFVISSSLFSQVAINSDGSSADSSAILDLKSNNRGLLPPRMSYEDLYEIPSPANGLIIYCTDCGDGELGAMAIYLGEQWYIFDISCLNPLSPDTAIHVPGSNQILWEWVSSAGAIGYKWNTTNNYSTAIDLDTVTSKTEYNLDCETSYSRYVWAYNACGHSDPTALTQSTLECWTCGESLNINHIAGPVAPVDKSTTYATITNIPGETSKCWITKNLGASNQPSSATDNTEAASGWYWQFNRMQGYKYEGSTRTPNTTWITEISEYLDWLTINDPCTIELGSGWRIPTDTEWTNVDDAGGWVNYTGPYNSDLTMHNAGRIDYSYGILMERGSKGFYWSSTQTGTVTLGQSLFFNSSNCYTTSNYVKAYGFSVRCIKD